jgi:hypothetical protein
MEKELTCVERDCGKTFTITESEERFYTDKGYYLPKRCADCRARRKREKEMQEQDNN